MRVLICGSRQWTDWVTILAVVSGFPPGTVVIEGEARGADRISRHCALACGLAIIPMPADWDRFHASAGPIRNSSMLELMPDLVIAFHDDLRHSKGTLDMMRKATRKEVPVVLIRSHVQLRRAA